MAAPHPLSAPLRQLRSLQHGNRWTAVQRPGERLWRIWDLLNWAPRRFITLTHAPEQRHALPELDFGAAEAGKGWALLEGALSFKKALRRPGRFIWTYELELSSGAYLELCCFQKPYWHGEIGRQVVVLGQIQREGYGPPRMVHPRLWSKEKWEQESSLWTLDRHGLLAIYPTLGQLPETTLRRALHEAMELLKHVSFTSEFDAELVDYPRLDEAVQELHGYLMAPYTPSEGETFERSARFQRARHRIGLEELIYFRMRWIQNFQAIPRGFNPLPWPLEAAKLKAWWEAPEAHSLPTWAKGLQIWREQLPFKLRPDQQSTLHQLMLKLLAPAPMRALLLGDVGSGKTVVAVALALLTALQGRSVLVMVPNLLLAHQHVQTFSSMLQGCGVKVHWMTGGSCSLPESELQAGEILIATQAPLYQKPNLQKLGLLILDEQHRFGVEQKRQVLNSLSDHYPHQLMMSATPIPRTFHLAQSFPENIFRLVSPSSGHRKTTVISTENLPKLLDRWKQEKENPAPGLERLKVFWVCARIEASEEKRAELKSLQARLQSLQAAPQLQGFEVLGLTGRMGEQEKLKILESFRRAQHAVLVCTTAVEVGIDVSDANFLVIENAENFGLAQIHQLRGRIGRAQQKAYCFLCPHGPVTEMTQKRLEILKENEDGAVIAAWDLKLRGQGETFSIRQSGIGGDFRHFRGFKNEAEASLLTELTSRNFSVERLQALHELWAPLSD